MVKYVFREIGPVLIKNRQYADPQKIGDALERARRETPLGQDMRTRAIEHARNRRNPLHQHLEWDDTVAADQFRRIQINQLICAIRIETGHGEQIPAFISVTPADGRKGFRTPEEVLTSIDLQIAMMRSAETELANWQRRFAILRDLAPEIEEAKKRIAERRAAYETHTAAA